MARELENEVGRFWLDDDGVLRCVVKDGAQQTREHALDSMRIYRQLCGSAPRPAVIDTSRAKGMDRDARSIYSGPDSRQVFTALALVVATSSVARAMVNFILVLSRTDLPVQVFETVDEALPWARARLPRA